MQKPLFDDDPAPLGLVTAAVQGSSRTLSREQKQFNKLIAQIESTRRELEVWREFIPQMRQTYLTQIEPALAALREKRLALVALFDEVMAGRDLKKMERRKLAEILCATLRELLTTGETPELVQLYNKYSGVSFEEEQQDNADLLQAMASDAFGVKLSADELAGSPDEVAARIAAKIQADEEAREARRAAKRTKGTKGKKAGKETAQTAREAQREQAAQGASKSVREVYRKLASELHPDREPDPLERERKTALMQKVNQAYDKGDLLALLELQLQIEQINPAALAGMARERIIHYNTVLTEQLQRLRDELEDLVAPFAMTMGLHSARGLSLQQVRASHDADVRELQSGLHSLDKDLHDFKDIAKLKQNLKHYRLGDAGGGDFDEIDEMLMESLDLMPRPGRSRRRR